MPGVSSRSVRIAVAKDGIRAHLVTTDVAPDLVTLANITSALGALKIPVTEQIIARIKQIEPLARGRQLPAEPMLLAEGRESVEGKGASFELAPSLTSAATEAAGDEDHIDFHRSQILTVTEGTAIGSLEPEVPAVAGIDVYGQPIPVLQPMRSVRLGENVRLDSDGRTVVAAKAGKVHLTCREVSIVPFVEIPSDVDFSTGNINSPTDVVVNGTVRESFQVKSAGSITVRGAIEAATVEAGTDLQVNGGIAARGHGKVTAGGEIFTRFCNDCSLEAAHDVTITREALSSNIRTLGRLMISRGKLIGGKSYAREGAEVFELGNDANIRTEIAVGIDPMEWIEAMRVDEVVKKKQEAIAKIRQNVQPLMAQLKRLTPAQRERATELLYQADSMEQEIQEAQKRKAAVMQHATAGGHEVTLFVQKIAYPGSVIIFGNKVATLHNERKGPFKVVRRVHNRVEEILLIDKLSGSITVLGSREYEPG